MNLTEVRARLQTEEARRAVTAWELRCGKFGQVERRHAQLGAVDVRDSGNPDVAFTVAGHAAVYGRKSLDLGGFQEVIERGSFDDVLDSAPDVWLRWDHDTRLSMARTRSSVYTLELRDDPKGLRFYSKVAPTSFAADLRILMDSGIIDQASFAFSDVDDTWTITEVKGIEVVTRSIHRIGALYDVTITAEGAYPQTDSSVVRSLAVSFAMDTGRLEARNTDEDAETAPEAASEPVEATSDTTAPDDAPEAESAGDAAAQDEPVSTDLDPADDAEATSATDAPIEGDDSAAGTEDEPTESPVKRKARMRMVAAIARHRADLE